MLAMAVMLDIVSVCAQCETFICRPCAHGLQSVTSGDSLNVGQVVSDRGIVRWSAMEKAFLRGFRVFALQRSNVGDISI